MCRLDSALTHKCARPRLNSTQLAATLPASTLRIDRSCVFPCTIWGFNSSTVPHAHTRKGRTLMSPVLSLVLSKGVPGATNLPSISRVAQGGCGTPIESIPGSCPCTIASRQSRRPCIYRTPVLRVSTLPSATSHRSRLSQRTPLAVRLQALSSPGFLQEFPSKGHDRPLAVEQFPNKSKTS